MKPLAIAHVRSQFPALSLADEGRARVYLDNPAGTQVPQQVVTRMTGALSGINANHGGLFRTSVAADALDAEVHQALADFYNAASADEIAVGQNMTTLTFAFSRGLGRRFQPGDEIVLSRMDHDANVSPWLLMAKDRGLRVRWMDFDPETYEFPDDALERVLSAETRLVALGYASNCTGTVNEVKRFAAQARQAGALVYVDAVQFAPHGAIDVQDLGADVVVSSSYKWFGPHMGMLWGRRALLEDTFAYKVRPAGNEPGHKFETGTGSIEGKAGVLGAIEYLEQFGRGATRRERLVSAWGVLADYERRLTQRLIDGLVPVKGLTVRGITSANAGHRRVPTVSFTVEGRHPDDLARHFAGDNIFVWSGHNYAIEPIARMGLTERGGVLRVGLAHYNTEAEVDQFLASLARALKS